MTLSEFQTAVHALYRGDGNTPSSTDTKWSQRTAILGAFINIWESTPVKWHELYVKLSDAADGDKTAQASTLAYSAPTDFNELVSYVTTVDSNSKYTYYEVIKPYEADQYLNQDAKKVYITGNKKVGYTVNFLRQPTVGDTIEYTYYKDASVPSATSDVIEMSDPYAAVHYTVGKLHEQDGSGDRAQLAYSIAENKLQQMSLNNELTPHFQPNTPMPSDYQNFGGGKARGFSRYGAIL